MKAWRQKTYDERLAVRITQNFQVSEICAKIIASRNLEFEEIAQFLSPKIKTGLPDPFGLSDMQIAVSHVISAIGLSKKITIFGDYDVDGGTSCAILKRFFREIGIEVGVYIPDRILEGYGPNSQALLNLKKNGTDLVIMVDCGTVAFAPLEVAKKAGLEIIVIDHHLGVIEKPEAIAVINPNLLTEEFPHKNLCAAGVSFLFIVALTSTLRKSGFFQNQVEPNLLDLLDLVALGTVCDVMPLTGLNRSFVAAGLKILHQRKNLGLRKICDLAGLSEQATTYSLGFIIGPRINAGGRIGKSDLGAKILASEDEEEISKIAEELEKLNLARKETEALVLQEAVQNLQQGFMGFKESDPVIFACASGWHQGVIGIVASRLKEKFNKPTVVIAIDEEANKGKASCRSIAGIDLGGEILKAKLAGLLLEGGGHAMAGGFSILPEKIGELHRFFCNNLATKITEILENFAHEYDLELDFAQVNLELLRDLAKLEPFGVGNPRPKFLLKNAYKMRASLVGANQEHLSCVFAAKSALGFGKPISAIAFRSTENGLTEKIMNLSQTKPVSLICHLEISNWMGVEKIKIQLEDAIID